MSRIINGVAFRVAEMFVRYDENLPYVSFCYPSYCQNMNIVNPMIIYASNVNSTIRVGKYNAVFLDYHSLHGRLASDYALYRL